MPTLKRYHIKALLANPDLRRKLIVEGTRTTQAREGIEISKDEAESSYYIVTEAERAAFFGLVPFRTAPGENDGRHVEFVRNLSSPSVRFDVALGGFRALEHAPLAYRDLALVGPLFTKNPAIGALGEAWQGVISRDDERYFRNHWEVTPNMRKRPWLPLHKGGEFSRFYFDSPLVIDWSESAQAGFHRLRDTKIYFREGVTWPRRTQRGFSVRYLPKGCVFSDKGPAFLPNNPADTQFVLGVLNSHLAEFLMRAITSFGSWELSALKRLPLPSAQADQMEDIGGIAEHLRQLKASWDTGNEVCTRFNRVWLLQPELNRAAATLAVALDAVLAREAALDSELDVTYTRLNDAVYRLYGVNDAIRAKIEAAIGERPAELVWPQMEGRTADQKRMEHVHRLLTYLVKRIVEADADALVCLQPVAHEPPLIERMRAELAACFLQQDPTALETELVNELKRRVKGYSRAETLAEWLDASFFNSHAALYQQRPLLWHLASSQESRPPAFSIIVHAHRFDRDALAKIRSVHIRDRLANLRREAAHARQDGREEERLDLLAATEEVEAFDVMLKHLQEGAHSGPEAGEHDYRILTPWKKSSERPQGWQPDIDDGIKVNIAPLARTGLLRTKAKFGAKEPED